MISKSSGVCPIGVRRTVAMHTGIMLGRTIRGLPRFRSDEPGPSDSGLVERTGDTANSGRAHRKRRNRKHKQHGHEIAAFGNHCHYRKLDCHRLKRVSTVRPSLANRPAGLEITSSKPRFVTFPARYHQVVETLRRDGQSRTIVATPCANSGEYVSSRAINQACPTICRVELRG